MNTYSTVDEKSLLEIQKVSKSFGNTPVLRGIDLSVREGEFLTLLGPSGCGKTTLIRIVAGFESLTSGDVLIDGKSVVSSPPYKRPLGMVFQSLALFPHLTIAQNISYGLKVRKVPKVERKKLVQEALEMVGLKGMESRYIGQISGGQKQRIALARAVVTKPRVLLLDEPLGALDLKIRRQMQTELKQIQEQLGTTFIFVTHDQEEALTMSDRVAVLRDGVIEQVADPHTIYTKPANRFVAEFVGDTNFFEGYIKTNDAGEKVFSSKDLPGEIIVNQVKHQDGVAVGVSLRPQHLVLTDSAKAQFQAVVTRRVYAGQNTRLWLKVADRELIADFSESGGNTIPKEGELVGLSWRTEYLSVVEL